MNNFWGFSYKNTLQEHNKWKYSLNKANDCHTPQISRHSQSPGGLIATANGRHWADKRPKLGKQIYGLVVDDPYPGPPPARGRRVNYLLLCSSSPALWPMTMHGGMLKLAEGRAASSFKGPPPLLFFPFWLLGSAVPLLPPRPF